MIGRLKTQDARHKVLAMRDFRNIVAWQKADDLAVQVYRLTESLPRSEIFGLTAQMRRAVISVAANIAEGSARATLKDYIHFLFIAKSSLVEVEYYLHLCQRLGYLEGDSYNGITQMQKEAARVLQGLIKHIQRQVQAGT